MKTMARIGFVFALLIALAGGFAYWAAMAIVAMLSALVMIASQRSEEATSSTRHAGCSQSIHKSEASTLCLDHLESEV